MDIDILPAMHLKECFEIQDEWTEALQNTTWEPYNGAVDSEGFFVNESIQKEIDINVHSWEEAMSQLWGVDAKLTYVWALMLEPGGYIGPHLDEKHQASAVIYLNPHWKFEWGGRLEFELPEDRWKSLDAPERGTTIIWERNMEQRHRVTPTSLDAPRRISLTTRWKKK